MDFMALGQKTVCFDRDVIQADGDERTASITGGFVVLVLVSKNLEKRENIFENFPAKRQIAAMSVGQCKEVKQMDIDHEEDCSADDNMNDVMTMDN